ncbi:hypothetical protein [Bacillus cereus]|uniref:Uncharacterized protein n=1 Tax=Bacillus cereus TaxID=1396 RepID=A0A9X7QN13_BACCE|nr:hypothetical protein [Bacillus cereus]QDZ76961.1 hypothetical protein D0437_29650 [Bacillus cereus]
MRKSAKWLSSILIVFVCVTTMGVIHAQADQINNQTIYGTQDDYLYMGTTDLKLQNLLQENGRVYYRLAPSGAMDTLSPVAIPPCIGEKYLAHPASLQGWMIQMYMRQTENSPGKWVQERKLDFYNIFRQYQGTAYHQYVLPF